MDNYICKIANLDEMNIKWDYEISKAIDDKSNWITWKERNIENFKNQRILPYYGILDNEIICEATVHLTKLTVDNSEGLVSDDTVYLSAFRTKEEYQNKGYFSRLFKYIISDLKAKGYKYATLGVEPNEKRNKEIYAHYGFNKIIKTATETYPDGTKIMVEYYMKKL